MSVESHTPNQNEKQRQAPQPNSKNELAVQTATELINTQHRLGLSLMIWDKNLNKITGKFNSIADLLRNPDFISKLSQELYVSNDSETTWFKLKIRNGKLAAITFMLTLHINWLRIINKVFSSYDLIIVGYTPGDGNTEAATTAIPKADVTPEKIVKYFPQLIGQTANNTKGIGKVICFILSKFMLAQQQCMLDYVSTIQGFSKNSDGKIRFSPPKMLREEVRPYLTVGVRKRQYPICDSTQLNEDITPILAPLFAEQKEFQIMLLYRLASWHQSFFAYEDVYSDNILTIKTKIGILVALLVAILKNTSYKSLDAPPIGPNIKPLKLDLENVNDGMLVTIDVFAADQVKKGEKGYDLLISDAAGANDNSNDVHHSLALISGYADMYIPKEMRCVLELGDVSVEYTAEAYKTALKRLDANLIERTERGCNNGDFIKIFNGYVDEVRNSIPDKLPLSKHNTYVMLITALRMYNEWYSPLFCPDIEQYIQEWLCSQEQDRQPLYDLYCSEYGFYLNQRIAEGYYHLILKEETTQIDRGTHTIAVDRDKRRIYVETTDSFDIAEVEMTSVADNDSLTVALYSEGYLPHNAKNEKSVRIAAITSDGTPYSLYVHAINYTLLTQENKLRFELLDKEANLFTYDEMPREGFLPLIKMVDGRFAGKMLRYATEESNIYFGSGKTGSGKSWAIAQILPMLFMLGHIVVVL